MNNLFSILHEHVFEKNLRFLRWDFCVSWSFFVFIFVLTAFRLFFLHFELLRKFFSDFRLYQKNDKVFIDWKKLQQIRDCLVKSWWKKWSKSSWFFFWRNCIIDFEWTGFCASSRVYPGNWVPFKMSPFMMNHCWSWYSRLI